MSDYISAHAASGFVAFRFGSKMQWRRQGAWAGGAEAPPPLKHQVSGLGYWDHDFANMPRNF